MQIHRHTYRRVGLGGGCTHPTPPWVESTWGGTYRPATKGVLGGLGGFFFVFLSPAPTPYGCRYGEVHMDPSVSPRDGWTPYGRSVSTPGAEPMCSALGSSTLAETEKNICIFLKKPIYIYTYVLKSQPPLSPHSLPRGCSPPGGGVSAGPGAPTSSDSPLPPHPHPSHLQSGTGTSFPRPGAAQPAAGGSGCEILGQNHFIPSIHWGEKGGGGGGETEREGNFNPIFLLKCHLPGEDTSLE